MQLYTDIEESLIKLTPINGGEEIVLPGVLQSLSVNGEILIDSNNSAGNREPQKLMRGYKDRAINITLKLLSVPKSINDVNTKKLSSKEEIQNAINTAKFFHTEIEKYPYDILGELNQLFQNKEDGIPTVYRLFNRHTYARGIEQVLFTSFSSSEDNTTETLTVTLTFEEFIEARYI